MQLVSKSGFDEHKFKGGWHKENKSNAALYTVRTVDETETQHKSNWKKDPFCKTFN